MTHISNLLRLTAFGLLFGPLATFTNGGGNGKPAPAMTPASASEARVSEGLAASDWSSIRAAYEANRHTIFSNESGWSARNPGQGLMTTFDRQ